MDPIIPLHSEQQIQAAELLARAFRNDPMMVYYISDQPKREKALPRLMRICLRYCLYYGKIDAFSGLGGLACWLPPGETATRTWRWIRSAVGLFPIGLGFRGLRKMTVAEDAIDQIHARCIPGPHWYLMLLGVSPDCQGKGIGGKLIENHLSQPDVSVVPCYLETMTEKNVAFYQRHGFKVVSDLTIDGQVKVWMMLRKPEQ